MEKLVDIEFKGGKRYVEIACLSSETKPTEGIVTGSKAWEIDTATVYGYESSTGAWYKQAELGGGS